MLMQHHHGECAVAAVQVATVGDTALVITSRDRTDHRRWPNSQASANLTVLYMAVLC